MTRLAVELAAAYGIGSIPFAYLIPRIFLRVDIREHGSGNPGATNVYRTMGPAAGLTVGALDFMKGYLGVAMVRAWDPELESWGTVAAGLAAIAGHNWPVWLGFRGGKGVITSAGVFLYLAWLPVLGTLAVFAPVFWLSGYVSLASMSAAMALPVLVFFLRGTWNAAAIETAAIAVALVIIGRHWSNMRRLVAGNENRLRAPGRLP